jgi:hypothetical protein
MLYNPVASVTLFTTKLNKQKMSKGKGILCVLFGYTGNSVKEYSSRTQFDISN